MYTWHPAQKKERFVWQIKWDSILNWLVVSNIVYFPFHIWDVILPIDEVHHFSRWLSHHQPVKLSASDQYGNWVPVLRWWFTTRPGKQSQKTDGKITMLLMGKLTISTGPFSMSLFVCLPEGNPGLREKTMVVSWWLSLCLLCLVVWGSRHFR